MQFWFESSSSKHGSGVKTLLQKSRSHSIETDAGGDPHANAGKRETPNPNYQEITMCSTGLPKDPNCEVCRIAKSSDARRWNLTSHGDLRLTGRSHM